jgi:hypothetical protein
MNLATPPTHVPAAVLAMQGCAFGMHRQNEPKLNNHWRKLIGKAPKQSGLSSIEGSDMCQAQSLGIWVRCDVETCWRSWFLISGRWRNAAAASNLRVCSAGAGAFEAEVDSNREKSRVNDIEVPVGLDSRPSLG